MFFMPEKDFPEVEAFTLYGPTHLLWLGFFIVLCTLSIILYKKLNAKHRNIMRIIIASIVFTMEIVKNCVAAAVGAFSIGHLPFHLCGISVILISFSIFKRVKTIENFLYYIGIPGAMLALLTPDWTEIPCLNFFHMHSFIIHMFLVIYPLLLVTSGEVKPNFKSMPKCILLLAGFAVPALIMNLLFDQNFMFLMRTDNIGFLVLFEKIFGAHQWVFPILLPMIMGIMSLPLIIANKITKHKKSKELVNT